MADPVWRENPKYMWNGSRNKRHRINNITITTDDFHPRSFLYFHLIPFSKHVSSCFYCKVKKKKMKETSYLHQKIKENETSYVPKSAFNNLNFISLASI